MKVVKPQTEILYPSNEADISEIYRHIELAGRTCYKSEDKITEDSAKKFIRALVKRGHLAMIEHGTMTVRFIVDRGITHEIVRHRIASYAQESTRYCNYSQEKFGNEITAIEPVFFINSLKKMEEWILAMQDAERHYFALLNLGATPEQARTVLPTSLKTELVVTMNMRSWRNFFKLRAAGETGKPHPQMLEIAVPLLRQCKELMPELFDDIQEMST